MTLAIARFYLDPWKACGDPMAMVARILELCYPLKSPNCASGAHRGRHLSATMAATSAPAASCSVALQVLGQRKSNSKRTI